MSATISVSPPGRILCGVVLGAGLATAPLDGASLAAGGVVALALTVATGSYSLSGRVLSSVALLSAVTLLPLTVTGLAPLALRLSARSILSCVAVASVVSPIAHHEIEGALLSLGAPRALATTVAGTLRQWARLADEGRRLLLARRLRGPVRARDGAALLGNLFERTAERAERIELAMALRGYAPERAGRRRPFGAWDLPFVGLCALTGVLVHAAGRVLG